MAENASKQPLQVPDIAYLHPNRCTLLCSRSQGCDSECACSVYLIFAQEWSQTDE